MITITITKLLLIYFLTNLISFFAGYFNCKKRCKIEIEKMVEKLREEAREDWDCDGGW